MTNEQLANQIAALGRITEQRFDSLEQTMMAQFEYVLREIRRVEDGGPRQDGREREYACPINGCDHVFQGGRAGWDSHVAAHGKHPDWLPRVLDGEERKQAFRTRFADWFSEPATE